MRPQLTWKLLELKKSFKGTMKGQGSCGCGTKLGLLSRNSLVSIKDWIRFLTMSTPSLINSEAITLTRWVLAHQQKFPQATGEFSQLMSAVQTAVKTISSAVRQAGIHKLYGLSGDENIQGEEVKKLDVISNNLFISTLRHSFSTSVLVSEENENAIIIEESRQGKYIVCFDPLDGSSNIDCLGSIGSIFAIYEKVEKVPSEKDALQPGRKIIAAGYALYGSATFMVLALKSSGQVNGFMLDPQIGEFILTESDMKVPKRGKIISVNEAYSYEWSPGIGEYVKRKKDPSYGKPYGTRYVGSMVSDIHRTLLYGGIFMYPSSKSAPNGKLRLLYECNPLAFIFNIAGGAATDGNKDILDIVPTNIHQRVPIFIGSVEDVKEVMSVIKQYSQL